jgi:ribosomal protein L12E/L44/L45/RPP1/RPP2
MKNNGIADFLKPTLITAHQYGTKVSVEIDHSDTDIDELMDAFHTLIIGLGYHDSAWKDWVVDRADEYKEEAAEEAMYEPSPELRRAAEEYVNMLSEKDIDEAISEHNAHEDESEFDDYGSRKPKKKTKKK